MLLPLPCTVHEVQNGLNNYEGTEKFSARFNTNINIADKFVLLADFYAHRLQNGVILIETERGSTGQFKVNLHTWAAIDDPIDLPNFVGAADYMRLNNEARTMQNQTRLYTDSQIDFGSPGPFSEYKLAGCCDAITRPKIDSTAVIHGII